MSGPNGPTVSPDAEPLGGRPAVLRGQNRRRILREIRALSPVSRASLAQITGLSHPTVSAIVTDLLEHDVARERGREHGGIGRPGTLLEFNATRGYVLGVDLGGTRIRAAVADLDGTFLVQEEQPTTHARGRAVVDQVLQLAELVLGQVSEGNDRLLAVGIGTPGVFDPQSERIRLAPNVEGLEDVEFSGMVSEALGVPVELENDVNMAALGERWRGVAQSAQAFAVIAIGNGIGLGIVLNGELWRGERGAAGEIAYVPIPVGLELKDAPQGPLEAQAGAVGLLAGVRRVLAERDDESPLRERDLDALGVRELFDLATEGDPIARAVCDEHAQVVTLAVATIATLLDPELIVLAGGIGNSEYLHRAIESRLPHHIPLPPPVLISGLGDAAQLYGAVAVAQRVGLAELESFLATNRRPVT